MLKMRFGLLVIILFMLITNLVLLSAIKAQNVNQTIEDIVDKVHQYCEEGQIYGAGADGLCNSLLKKLENAMAARDRGQPHVACNILNAFANEVEAQQDKSIESESAEILIKMADDSCIAISVTPTPSPTLTPTITPEPIEPVYITVWEGVDPTSPDYMEGYGPDEGVTTTVEVVVENLSEFELITPQISAQTYSTTSTQTLPPVDITIHPHIPITDPDYMEGYGPDEDVTTTVEVVVENELVEFVIEDDVEPISPTIEAHQAEAYDNWELLMTENFEGDYPQPSCNIYSRPNTQNSSWGPDDYRQFYGDMAGWPARIGVDRVDPEFDDYLPNMYSLLICGPYDRSNAQTMMVRYGRWLDIADPDDKASFGYSFDGETFTYTNWQARKQWQPVQFTIQLQNRDGNIWFSWRFVSDDDNDRAEGAWIDELEIWRYNRPEKICGNLDPGDKGVVVEPYQRVGNQDYPIIRPGYHDVLDKLIEADVKWVRLGFKIGDDGIINKIIQYRHYDYMIDALCMNGIAVLGLINHQSISRQDINEPSSASSYRNEFNFRIGIAVDHFQNRITYWEVWNEPDYDPDPGAGTLPPRVEPELYAPLLVETAQKIKEKNPDAKVLHGGLAGAWSRDYFDDVYRYLNELGGLRPFDYFAIHPYFDETHGYDPQQYLRAETDTILGKFMFKMDSEGDGHKRTWVTEIGWNSGKDNPHPCWPHMVSEDEQAAYLKKGFDILFNEVKLWNTSCPAVEKVIWYQFMDVSIPQEALCPNGARQVNHWKGYVPTGNIPTLRLPRQGAIPWYWGLYKFDSNYQLVAKPSQEAFAAYPQTSVDSGLLPYKVYLPIIYGGSNVECPY